MNSGNKSHLYTGSCVLISLFRRVYSFDRVPFIIVVRIPGHFELSGAPDPYNPIKVELSEYFLTSLFFY